MSYDSFNKGRKNIYRVMRTASNLNGGRREFPYLSAPYSAALLNDYPDAIQKRVQGYARQWSVQV